VLYGIYTRREKLMDEQRRVAPWPDFVGNQIREGDSIRHPADGLTGVVFVLCNETDVCDQWRVLYDTNDPGRVARLCLQIGDKGQAVVVPYNT
jgi:hypothetical protein